MFVFLFKINYLSAL